MRFILVERLRALFFFLHLWVERAQCVYETPIQLLRAVLLCVDVAVCSSITTKPKHTSIHDSRICIYI